MFELIWSFNSALAWLIGIYTFVHSMCMITRCLIRNFIRKPLDLTQRYGKGSWVVITGPTGGIGSEYCKQLAKQGFNLVLLGRNKQKLDDLEAELKRDHPQLKTKIVVADFGEDISPEFYEKLYDQMKDLDVSMLINNAAWLKITYFGDLPPAETLSRAKLNMGGPALLISFFINDFLKRATKTAIINISSLGSTFPFPYTADYSGSKRFLSLLSYYLHDNYGDKIDVQDLNPGVVTTKLGEYRDGPEAISPERCVKSSLRDLGQEFSTVPTVVHSLSGQFVHVLYRFCKPIYSNMFVNVVENAVMTNFYKENRDKIYGIE
ncbi:unnamed protein product [Moneuplotes crassus]|uniref:Uncharacterized protein n=1 Tax=Euplotes crassus TaxID=5936 RepID=A0AAD1XP01_EUPCR|nr:unnamed protein product [Moneuplotes crassus]